LSLRNKLKESQMRLVELASYLGISRPTLYKYLELYEAKEYNEIDKRTFDLFTFIDNTRNIKRPALMDYLINKIIPMESSTGSDVETISNVRKLSESNNDIDKKKMEVINVISSSTKFDDVMDLLARLSNHKTKVTINTIINKINKGENQNG